MIPLFAEDHWNPPKNPWGSLDPTGNYHVKPQGVRGVGTDQITEI